MRDSFQMIKHMTALQSTKYYIDRLNQGDHVWKDYHDHGGQSGDDIDNYYEKIHL